MSAQIIFQKRFEQRLQAFIQAQPQRTDRIVYEVTSDVKTDIQAGWPVDSGVSRAAFDGPNRVGHAHWQISNPMPYAARIEYGTYPGVGPKTVEGGGYMLANSGIFVEPGIFPAQTPAAPVRRALAKHHNDIAMRLAADMQKRWGR